MKSGCKKRKRKILVAMKLSLEGKKTLTLSLKRISQHGPSVAVWNHKNALEYTLPLTLIRGLMFQLKKSDLNVCLNSESGSISSTASCLCRLKSKVLHKENKSSLDTHTSAPHFPKCHPS